MASANRDSTLNSGKGMLVIIDPAVEDYALLAAGVLPGASAIVIDKNQDAIAQITAALHSAFHNSASHNSATGRTLPYNSIHLIAPNAPGVLQFSSGEFSLKTLEHYVDSIQTWFAAETLAAGTPTVGKQALEPQLLLYGRRVGAGQSGTELIDTLSWLTGAAVIASKNGDRWPHINGNLAQLAFTQSFQQSYRGTFSD